MPTDRHKDASRHESEDLVSAARREAAELARPVETSSFDASTETPVRRGRPFAPPPPGSFAGYEIVKEVHRGGQGVVYRAIHESTGRKVAIKVMREGPFAGDSDQARFDREVKILGQLDHPNIVTIHDTGMAAGFHYFVMDYVSGQPLDVYMASARRGIGETLRLFAKICEAVNAAHLRGVIHRDLKPSNIRVDPEGEPRILDFGLAKVAVDAVDFGAGAVEMTQTGQFVGSLPWASPEQAEGAPSKIDVRTDVYSLGVIAYQMLTGKFPYDVIGNMPEVLGRIMGSEPVRPSTLRREINDEVETIVLKCLAKGPERRYQSAGELGRDVARYLAGEPIEAKRDSVGYLLRKQIRRHRVPVAVTTAFILLALGFGVTLQILTAVERDRAEREAEAARVARDRAERIAQFMEDMLAAVKPTVALGRDTTLMREVLDSSVARILNGELHDVPDAELRMRLVIGDTYREIQAHDAAHQMLDPVVELARSMYPGDHAQVAAALEGYALLIRQEGDAYLAEEALPIFEEALEMRQRLYPGDHPRLAASLYNVGGCLRVIGQTQDAWPYLNAALKMRQRLFPGDHPDVAESLYGAGYCVGKLGRAERARAMQEAALAMNLRLYPDGHPNVLWSLSRVALSRPPEDALPILETALEIERRIGPFHPTGEFDFYAMIASCLQRLGRAEEALSFVEQSLGTLRDRHPEDHPRIAEALDHKAEILLVLDRGPEAVEAHEAALQTRQRLHPGDHPDTAWSLERIGRCLEALGRQSEAQSNYDAAVEMFQRLFEAGRIHAVHLGDHPEVARSLIRVALQFESMNHEREALPIHEAALDMYQQLFDAERVHVFCKDAAMLALQEEYSSRLAELIDAWRESDSNNGYCAKAADWRNRYDRWLAASRPAELPEWEP